VRRVVVLGTGTGVGKTYVTVALAKALRSAGATAVQALKPVETGIAERGGEHQELAGAEDTTAPFRRDSAAVSSIASGEGGFGGCPPVELHSDADRLEAASFHVQRVRPHPLLAFPEPVSPHLASRRSGTVIDVAAITRWVRSAALALSRPNDVQIVETAGGAFSPLNPDAVNLDLALALRPALLLLVAPDSLGVLHDLRATLLAMKTVGLSPDAVVLSAARAPDASTGTNAAELAGLGIARPIAVIPSAGDGQLDTLTALILSHEAP
jgi:dethiobiotin synthetase